MRGRGVFGAEGAAYGGEEEGGVDLLERNAAVVEGFGKAPVFWPGAFHGAGGAAVVFEDDHHEEVAVHELAQPSGSRRDGPSMVTVWQ